MLSILHGEGFPQSENDLVGSFPEPRKSHSQNPQIPKGKGEYPGRRYGPLSPVVQSNSYVNILIKYIPY